MAKKQDKIRVIYKRVGFDPVEVEIDNDLDTLWRMIGGYIETVPWLVPGTIMLVDEEGKLDDRPVNFPYMGDYICGSVMWVGVDGDEFTDYPDTLRTFLFKHPWLWDNNEIEEDLP